jgi:hypothetical protein
VTSSIHPLALTAKPRNPEPIVFVVAEACVADLNFIPTGCSQPAFGRSANHRFNSENGERKWDGDLADVLENYLRWES